MSRLLTRNWTRRGGSGLIVPGGDAVPLAYNATRDTRLWKEIFNYPDLPTFDAAYDRNSGVALFPNTISPEQDIVDSGIPGKRAFANNFNGIATDAPKCWVTVPAGLRPDPALTTSHKFRAKINIDLSHAPWIGQPLREKWYEVYHGYSRTQFSLTDSETNSGSDITSSVWMSPGQAFPTPTSLGFQKRGPYPGDLLRVGGWHYYEMEQRTHTAANGLTNNLIETCLVKLRSGSPPAVGARMTLRNTAGAPVNQMFGASYEVMSVVPGTDSISSYQGVSLQRRYDGLATTDYGYDPIQGFSLATYRSIFDLSQAGKLATGDYIATYNGSTMGGFRVTGMLDDYTALIARNGDDSVGGFSQLEQGGCRFSRSTDGFTGKARMWIDGVLVLDHSLSAIGAPVVNATLQMLSQYPVAQTWEQVALGDNQTSGPGIWNPPEDSPTPLTPWSIHYTDFECFSTLEAA